jgi:alpha-galactosidase
MTKISFIGAGSTVFAKNLLGDILSYPELQDATISLFDIDPARLRTSEIVAHKIADFFGASPKIEATLDRRASLAGADFAISMFQVGGYKPGTVIDFEIPKKYGLRQTIADTLGIGGIMRGLRTIPVFLDIARDMEELCPDVTFLQYVNPMAMNCWALSRASSIKTVGLCHSVQGTAEQLAGDIGVPIEEINYPAPASTTWPSTSSSSATARDLYPRIRRSASTRGACRTGTACATRCSAALGYFVTESSEHFSEYVPWFIKRDRPDLIEQFNIPLDEYIRRCEVQSWEIMRAGRRRGRPIRAGRVAEITFT